VTKSVITLVGLVGTIKPYDKTVVFLHCPKIKYINMVTLVNIMTANISDVLSYDAMLPHIGLLQ